MKKTYFFILFLLINSSIFAQIKHLKNLFSGSELIGNGTEFLSDLEKLKGNVKKITSDEEDNHFEAEYNKQHQLTKTFFRSDRMRKDIYFEHDKNGNITSAGISYYAIDFISEIKLNTEMFESYWRYTQKSDSSDVRVVFDLSAEDLIYSVLIDKIYPAKNIREYFYIDFNEKTFKKYLKDSILIKKMANLESCKLGFEREDFGKFRYLKFFYNEKNKPTSIKSVNSGKEPQFFTLNYNSDSTGVFMENKKTTGKFVINVYNEADEILSDKPFQILNKKYTFDSHGNWISESYTVVDEDEKRKVKIKRVIEYWD